MIQPNSMKYRFLEMIAISGEFPSSQIGRLFSSPSYAEKMITQLKADGFIRLHYRDKLRGYRLTKRAKDILMENNPKRFDFYLSGNTETNRIRSDPPRRMRLHQKAETYLTLQNSGIPVFPDEKPGIFHGESSPVALQDLPIFYSSREIKTLPYDTTKIRNSRSMGILLGPACVYALYNTGSAPMKWEYKTEVRLNALMQHHLQGRPYTGRPNIRAILTGTDMETAFHLMTSTGGYKKSLFMLDTSFEHFHYLPNAPEGELLLKLLTAPDQMLQLNRLLLSDMLPAKEDLPIEHDALSAEGKPVLLAYDFDMQRITRFNAGLHAYRKPGIIICFDFQLPCLKKYITADIQISCIDLHKFKRSFLYNSNIGNSKKEG